MERTKQNATSIFMHDVYRSWTYGRMTKQEQERLETAVDFAENQGMIKGTFETRWKILQAVYNAFLVGIGYNGFTWREPNPDEVPAF
jgi:hypothetical protein